MEKIDPVAETWDKKKIGIAIIVIISLIGIGFWSKVLVLGNNKQSISFRSGVGSSSSVEGASTESTDPSADSSSLTDKNQGLPFSFSSANIQADAQQKLNEVKQQISSLSIQDIASSSPQVQKVINDLKSLQDYPKDQAKQMCENICKSF